MNLLNGILVINQTKHMKKIYLLLLLCALMAPVSFLCAQWTTVGNADFSSRYAGSTSLAFDNNGTPYIAFSDGNNAGKATVMKLSGGSWVVVGTAGFSPASATYLSLTMRGATPIVAFSDAGNGSKAMAMKLNNSNVWVNIGSADFSAGAAYNTTVAVDSVGYTYVAYTDVANGSKATVMSYNGTAWTAVGGAGFSPASAAFPAMIIKGNTPYVVFSDGASSITVMSYNGSSWVTEGNRGFGGNPQSVSIAADNTGGLYVSAAVTTQNGFVYAYKLEGGTWTQLGSGALSSGVGQAPQIATDASNTPYVAYIDIANSSKATLMKYSGSNWTAVGTEGFTPGKAYDVSLAIGPGNAPYVGFADYTDSNKVTLMTYGGTAAVETVNENIISLYPNPVKSGITVNTVNSIIDVTIYDLNGRTVLEEKQPQSNHFDISNLTGGMYLVKITTAQATFVRKIVKD